MIETPMTGRFWGEGRRLVVAPPPPYLRLVAGVCVVGVVMVTAVFTPIELAPYREWWLMVGSLLILAGVAAALSLQWVAFDLKEKTYRRWQGPGFLPKYRAGRTSELDAVVVISEVNASLAGGGVTYHVVLHWRPDAQAPILVMHQESHRLPAGVAINANAAACLQLGSRYAQGLGIKFFDNSYYPSACPVPLWH